MKTKITIALMLIGMIGFAQSRYRNTAVDSASVLVSAGFTNITNINIAYPATTIVYLKFYDSATKVYAKAATPVWTMQIGTDATLSYSLKSFSNLKFKNGVYIRCVTSISDTAQTAVQPATKPLVEITY